jgi:hypothetical protein
MKTKNIIIGAVLTIGALIVVNAQLAIDQKPYIIQSNPEFPKVIIPVLDEKGCPRNGVYQAEITFEFNPKEGEVLPPFDHCAKCRIGVYSEHKGETGISCTYCKDKKE